MEGRQAVSDLIQLRIGERPWLPTPKTESIEIFGHYDMPISGLIKQGETLFVFDCVEGHVMAGNIWIYAQVDSEEAERLTGAEGDEFDILFDQTFTGRSVMAALAVDGHIRSGAQIDPEKIEKDGLLKAILDRLSEGMEVAGATAEAMRHLVAC
jgi:hypothetical protein